MRAPSVRLRLSWRPLRRAPATPTRRPTPSAAAPLRRCAAHVVVARLGGSLAPPSHPARHGSPTRRHDDDTHLGQLDPLSAKRTALCARTLFGLRVSGLLKEPCLDRREEYRQNDRTDRIGVCRERSYVSYCSFFYKHTPVRRDFFHSVFAPARTGRQRQITGGCSSAASAAAAPSEPFVSWCFLQLVRTILQNAASCCKRTRRGETTRRRGAQLLRRTPVSAPGSACRAGLTERWKDCAFLHRKQSFSRINRQPALVRCAGYWDAVTREARPRRFIAQLLTR